MPAHQTLPLPVNLTTRRVPDVKIAYIGGGSREWAVKLMGDLALSDALGGVLELYDIDPQASAYNQGLGEQIFSHPDARSKFRVRSVRTLGEALQGADFVVISIEPGPVSCREADLEIPARYGILQSVGDTTGPGGLLRALRCVPVYRDIVTFIMEHCPQAWVINYTNPMAVCTGALFRAAPQIHAFGCCHEVFGTQKMLAKKVSEWFDVPEPPREEIALDIAGVNHFTFATEVSWQGEDLLPRLLEMVADDGFFRDRTAEARRAKEQGLWFDHAGLIAYDFLRRFGALGAAGDRHLAEFVSWYLCDEASLHRWGTLATPYTWRLERSRCARPTLAEVAREGLKPSGEEGVQQIEALLGLRPLTTNINLPNVGQIADLPKQAVVETYAEIGRGHIRPLVARPLPPALLAIEARIARQQLLLLEAAWEGDTDLAFQVLLADPLVNIPTDRAWRMFQEMLAAIRYPRSRHG